MTSHQSSIGSPLPGSASWLTLGIAGGTTLSPAFIHSFFLWIHQHIWKSPCWPLVTWSAEVQELRVKNKDYLFCFTLPELGPAARLCGCGSVHLGTCWTWRIGLFVKRAASSSRQRFGSVVFSSAKSRKRADGNMEGILLDWAKKEGRTELQCWFCVPGLEMYVCGRAMHLHLLFPPPPPPFP